MTGHYHKLRRFVGMFLLAVLVVIPFLRIHGRSAFRFDIPTLRLYVFGSEIWMADFFVILIGLIFLTFLILFVTTMFGRIWCGWLCPQTVFIDTVDSITPRRVRNPAGRFLSDILLVLASAVVAASLIGYFVDPYDVPSLLRSGGTAQALIQGSWISLTVILFLDARLLGRKFCSTVCPYARMQGVLFDDRTLQVAYDVRRQNECMDCKACVRSCPVHIDIRQGLQMACIHCAECADACASRMAMRGRKSLIGYSRGIPGKNASGFRANPFIIGAVTVLSALFLLYLAATKMPFDMTVRFVYPASDSRSAQQSGIAYDVSFRNMTEQDITASISVSAPQGEATIVPQTVLIKAGSELTRIKASIHVAGPHPDRITLTARSLADGKSISKSIQLPKLPDK